MFRYFWRCARILGSTSINKNNGRWDWQVYQGPVLHIHQQITVTHLVPMQLPYFTLQIDEGVFAKCQAHQQVSRP